MSRAMAVAAVSAFVLMAGFAVDGATVNSWSLLASS
jgi:hypothetical protein